MNTIIELLYLDLTLFYSLSHVYEYNNIWQILKNCINMNIRYLNQGGLKSEYYLYFPSKISGFFTSILSPFTPVLSPLSFHPPACAVSLFKCNTLMLKTRNMQEFNIVSLLYILLEK